jgi:peptidoglycan/LPS O-acetylase OafA/YrhL
MAAGEFAAALYFFHKDFALKLMNLKIQFFIIVSVILICIFSNDFFKSHEILSLLFSILILNFAFSEKILFNLEIQPIKYLGKISYGLYMYQFIAITIVLKSNVSIGINSLAANIYYYFRSLSLTIIISIISYEFFEKRFIRFKEKFQIVKSIT